ncbi:MAG: Hsp33 family molecular chaperone HslO [Proteobacteria bacterium]|nr:Hsp33 family molecular chaperone HslO [Pseudomonadota bacterium]
MVPDLSQPSAGLDAIQPFQVEGLHLSGRLVRLSETVDSVLRQHDYPVAVSSLLGELMALAAALGSGLKFDGRMTVETRGDGPIRLIAVDYMSSGQMRGYASYDAERVAAAQGTSAGPVPRLIGNGLMALTIDQGPQTELYQGLVSLEGATLADCAHNYFRQSEQIDTALKLAVAHREGSWRAGALTMQRIAELGAGDTPVLSADREDDWRKAVALLSTATSEELTDPGLSSETLLYRLFHEDGVRVYERKDVSFGCTCSEQRAMAVLRRIPATEIDDLLVDGVVEVVCQFCNRRQVFTPEEIATRDEGEST